MLTLQNETFVFKNYISPFGGCTFVFAKRLDRHFFSSSSPLGCEGEVFLSPFWCRYLSDLLGSPASLPVSPFPRPLVVMAHQAEVSFHRRSFRPQRNFRISQFHSWWKGFLTDSRQLSHLWFKTTSLEPIFP
uniref:Uncharacterized protein n=1 Tax=Rousettus aegyptiacus TaxID=9407 RepID=A0A7J8E8R7_ROUAE|nr:hypothetical protein HJG63_008110 [Rousettus aegyptiacus]